MGDEEQVRALAQRIDAELAVASRHVLRLRRQNGWLGYTSIVAGALASLLAGGASTGRSTASGRRPAGSWRRSRRWRR